MDSPATQGQEGPPPSNDGIKFSTRFIRTLPGVLMIVNIVSFLNVFKTFICVLNKNVSQLVNYHLFCNGCRYRNFFERF